MCLHCIGVNEDYVKMNYLLVSCVSFSSLSFIGYSISYFTSSHMKTEFERFKLKKFGVFVIVAETIGALGLLAGLLYAPILLLSSAGLAILMLLGLIIRIKSKDSFWVSSPAIFYMILNAYIVYLGCNQ